MSKRQQREDQIIALDRVQRAHDAIIDAKKTMRRELEARFEAELFKLEMAESYAANQALQLGVPKTRIGRAMGTTNWTTITDRLELTAEQFVEPEETPWYEYNPEDGYTTFYYLEHGGERMEGLLRVKLNNKGGLLLDNSDWQNPEVRRMTDFFVEDLRYPELTKQLVDVLTEMEK